MSPTDEQRLRRFFARKLVPAAQALQGRDVRFFPLGPDPAESWYEDAPVGEPEFVEIEVEDCERMLREMWERDGTPELAALAADLMTLAREIEFDEEQSADVSPFMYVIY